MPREKGVGKTHIQNTPYTAIAFDYGLKKIGVAIGQSLLATTQPLTMLGARDGQPQWPQIEALIKEWQPSILVVGLPLNMDDSTSEMAERASKFARRLHGRFGLPSHTWDERLTSVGARERLASGAATKRDSLDSVAAQLILESWFERYPELP